MQVQLQVQVQVQRHAENARPLEAVAERAVEVLILVVVAMATAPLYVAMNIVTIDATTDVTKILSDATLATPGAMHLAADLVAHRPMVGEDVTTKQVLLRTPSEMTTQKMLSRTNTRV